MSEPREWTIYLRHGKPVPAPLMNAEAVLVIEKSAYEQLRSVLEEIAKHAAEGGNEGYLGTIARQALASGANEGEGKP